MKKIIIITIILLLTSGCSLKKENLELDNNNLGNNEEKVDIESDNQQIAEYQDTNPIKVALYQKSEGTYKRQDKFLSKMESYKDIGLFSIILTNEEMVQGKSIKSLYNEYKNNYENFKNYKIGYNISFELEDGTSFKETILKPKDVFDYSFSDYLYVWLYDDINNSGYYSHLESNDYNSDTVMSSIKLMSTSLSLEIKTPIELTVFTYDSDDFDELGHYRGISKFTMLIEKIS